MSEMLTREEVLAKVAFFVELRDGLVAETKKSRKALNDAVSKISKPASCSVDDLKNCLFRQIEFKDRAIEMTTILGALGALYTVLGYSEEEIAEQTSPSKYLDD